MAEQVATIKLGLAAPVVKVDSLAARRDVTDIRDLVRAYWLAATKGHPGEVYNVFTGVGVAAREILRLLTEFTGADIEVREGDNDINTRSSSSFIGDSTKFREATAWRPQFQIDRTVEYLAKYWEARVSADGAL